MPNDRLHDWWQRLQNWLFPVSVSARDVYLQLNHDVALLESSAIEVMKQIQLEKNRLNAEIDRLMTRITLHEHRLRELDTHNRWAEEVRQMSIITRTIADDPSQL